MKGQFALDMETINTKGTVGFICVHAWFEVFLCHVQLLVLSRYRNIKTLYFAE